MDYELISKKLKEYYQVDRILLEFGDVPNAVVVHKHIREQGGWRFRQSNAWTYDDLKRLELKDESKN